MIDAKWIDEKIEFIVKKNGFFNLRNNVNYFLEPDNNIKSLLKSGEVKKLNDALMLMSIHLSLKSFPVIEEWHDYDFFFSTSGADDEPIKSPGLITYSDPNHSKIKIDSRLRFMPDLLGAILAHELMHFYLFSKNIYYVDTEENEKFTDFATVYFGLGKFTVVGYEKVVWNWTKNDFSYTETYQVGYLKPSELILIMARVAKLRLIDIETLMINMTNYQYKFSKLKDFKDLIRINDYINGLEKKTKLKKYFLKNKVRNAEQKERSIISCPVCYNRMKILDINEMIKVNCKKCSTVFIYLNKGCSII